MLEVFVSARLVLRNSSASAHADSAISRFLAICCSADFRAENILGGPYKAPNNSGRIPNRKSVDPHPADRIVRPDDAELFVERTGLNSFTQPRKNANAILGVND